MDVVCGIGAVGIITGSFGAGLVGSFGGDNFFGDNTTFTFSCDIDFDGRIIAGCTGNTGGDGDNSIGGDFVNDTAGSGDNNTGNDGGCKTGGETGGRVDGIAGGKINLCVGTGTEIEAGAGSLISCIDKVVGEMIG